MSELDRQMPATVPSPLMICDRLITLAQDADRAGYATTAGRLVRLATRLFDEKPVQM